MAGTIRWNPTSEDFEGYTGSEWVSFTGGEFGDLKHSLATADHNGWYLLLQDLRKKSLL